MWLPSVIASTPAANSSSAIFGVMPSPPAAFSPLTTTNVGCVALAQHRQAVEQRAPADAADEVADEQDARLRRPHRRGVRLQRAQPYLADGGEDTMSGATRARPQCRRGPRRSAPNASCRARGRPDSPSASRRRRRPARSCRDGCSSCCCRSRCWRCGRSRKAAGKVLLMFVIAALIALILNPAVAFLQRPRVPRGLAVLIVYLAFFLDARRDRLAAGQPDLQPGAHVHAQPSAHRQASQQDDRRTCRANSTTTASTLHFVKQGETALQTHRGQGRQERPARSSPSAAACSPKSASAELRPRARVRAVRLHARLRPAHRQARTPRQCPTATARPPTTTRRSSSTPSPATSAASCCSAS